MQTQEIPQKKKMKKKFFPMRHHRSVTTNIDGKCIENENDF